MDESETTGTTGDKSAQDGAGCSGEAGTLDERQPLEVNPIVCDGIDKCKMALMRASKNALPHNFIEGMVCDNGCIGGAACLSHGVADIKEIEDYGTSSEIKEIGLVAGK
jgi:hypothetical protein